ncbi:hypothetical protein [Brevundimonas balnearis]|uniref:Uncharacterized protein n=1 Tax=Brevundimonas balnearis TaxID=1572858 RepID=A0ABV6R2X9_9CAUL
MFSSASPVATGGFDDEPPPNPWAADSPWPQFHRNSHAQKASPFAGPEAGDVLLAQTIRTPVGTGTPTQMHLSERYPDGSRTAWSTTLNSIVKARIAGDRFEIADVVRLHRGLGLVSYWNMQLARSNKAFVPNPRERSIMRFGDMNPRDAMSPIVREAEFALPASVPGNPIVLNLSHDGWVIFLTDAGWLGAVKQDFSDARYFDLSGEIADDTIHNSFPLDENGVAYFVSFEALTAVQWDGDGFRVVWRAPYDFRGSNCPAPSRSKLREVLRVFRGERCTGSGTTPTLLTVGDDRLVAAVDGHDRNNLIYFWRDAIPESWPGLPGRDRRIAGVVPLPLATSEGEGFTVENSPAAASGLLVIAQFAGFEPDCTPPMGVQAVRWNSTANSGEIAWQRPDVHFNGIPTISRASGMVYGVGLSGGGGCDHVYRGLDLTTGATRVEGVLGRGREYLDQGNTHALNDDGSLIYGSPIGMVRIRAAPR